MPFKPQIKTINEDVWHSNALVFETEQEAKDNAYDLFSRWMLAVDHRAVEVDDSHVVNYRYVNRTLESVAGAESPVGEANDA
jgi:hypothetical protein